MELFCNLHLWKDTLCMKTLQNPPKTKSFVWIPWCWATSSPTGKWLKQRFGAWMAVQKFKHENTSEAVPSLLNSLRKEMTRSACSFCTDFHFPHLTPTSEELINTWLFFLSLQGRSWIVKRSYEDFRVLDKHLHLCIYDRRFSQLSELPRSDALKDSPEVNYQQLKHSHHQGAARRFWACTK